MGEIQKYLVLNGSKIFDISNIQFSGHFRKAIWKSFWMGPKIVFCCIAQQKCFPKIPKFRKITLFALLGQIVSVKNFKIVVNEAPIKGRDHPIQLSDMCTTEKLIRGQGPKIFENGSSTGTSKSQNCSMIKTKNQPKSKCLQIFAASAVLR